MWFPSIFIPGTNLSGLDESFSIKKPSAIISLPDLKSPAVFHKDGEKWGLIEGWSEGLKGMKVGGIRELTIPSDKAYGAQGSVGNEDSSKNIGPNTPLKFIIMLIPEFKEIPQPNLEGIQ